MAYLWPLLLTVKCLLMVKKHYQGRGRSMFCHQHDHIPGAGQQLHTLS